MDNADDRVPSRLIDGLRAIDSRAIPVPTRVEEGILRRARERCAAIRRRRVGLRLVAMGAVAAALLAFAGLRLLDTPPATRTAERPRPVTILDAFALAKRIESGAPSRPEDDMNGDGRVDRQDVDRLAMAAVTLSQRPEGGR